MSVFSAVSRALLAFFQGVYRFFAGLLIVPILKFLSFVLTYVAFITAAFVATGASVITFVDATTPDPQPQTQFTAPLTTRVVDADGRESFRVAKEYRLFVPVQAMPPVLVQAFLAAEDQRFLEHDGIDGQSFARAMLQNARKVFSNERLIGGSTLTQQVAKQTLGSERTVSRKLREAVFATKLERDLSKQQILEIYLNEVFLGANTYGVGAAAERYFGKKINDLDLSEVAYLAALPKGPVNYHPTKHAERARARRNWVLGRMVELGFIASVDAEVASARALPKELFFGLKGQARGYYNRHVNRELKQRFGDNAIATQGLDVVTNFDPEIQAFTQTTLKRHLLELDVLMGYRGPLTRIDMADPNWDQRFLSYDAATSFPDWRKALVLKSTRRTADILLDDGRIGRLRIGDLTWARKPSLEQVMSNAPQRVSDVVKRGDIILVEAEGSGPIPAMDKNAPDIFKQAALLRDELRYKSGRFDRAPAYRLRQMPELNGAAVVLDLKTMHIEAIAGGFSEDAVSEFNRAAQAQRQPGSTIKPFVVLAALEQGLKPESLIEDRALTMTLPGNEVWSPSNYDGQFWGSISLQDALVYSRNVPMVNLYKQLGEQALAQKFQDLNLYSSGPILPSSVLGAKETDLLSLAAAYAAIANGGQYREPSVIDEVRDKTGMLIFTSDQSEGLNCLVSAFCKVPTSNSISTPEAVASLKGILRRVMSQGTGRSVQNLISKPVWGKTGTTNGSRDTWFVGFDEQKLVAVYVGFDQPRSMGKRATGGRFAGPIFADLVNGLTQLREGQSTPGDLIAQFDPDDAFVKARAGETWFYERAGSSRPAAILPTGNADLNLAANSPQGQQVAPGARLDLDSLYFDDPEPAPARPLAQAIRPQQTRVATQPLVEQGTGRPVVY